MATKKATAVQLTPAEDARAKAALMLQISKQIEDLETKKEELRSTLTEYVKTTGDTALGSYNVVIGEPKPAIDWGGLTANMKAGVEKTLMAELPDFVLTTQKLDVPSLYFAQANNATVRNAMTVRNLGFKLEATYTFRKAS